MSINPRKRAADSQLEPSQVYSDPFELANAVTSVLEAPNYFTTVSTHYSNDRNPGGEVQAYAKIAGKNWTFFVKSLKTTIGRNTDANKATNDPPVDIDLGPAKVVSRRHASINYNLQTRVWELHVSGRNGAKIDTVRIPTGENAPPAQLKCGTVIDIGGTQMMFILPDTNPEISSNILNIVAKELPGLSDYLKRSSQGYDNRVNFGNPNQGPDSYFFNQQKSHEIASKMNVVNTMKSSQQSLANLETDLSRDEAKDIKPPYSYATMITQAILSNSQGVLSLSEIYEWIASHYSFYRYSKTGWQNSIRHNLSLNKAFEKVPRRPNEPGKGMKWQIAESYKQDFLNSIASGSMSKIKRGSSVTRQLQLHLATHHNLPAGGSNPAQQLPPQQLPPPQQQQIQQKQQQQQIIQQQQLPPPQLTPQSVNNIVANQQHQLINNANNANYPPMMSTELSKSANLYLQKSNQQYSQSTNNINKSPQKSGNSQGLSFVAAAAAASANHSQINSQNSSANSSQSVVPSTGVSSISNNDKLIANHIVPANGSLAYLPENTNGNNEVNNKKNLTPSPKLSTMSNNSNKENDDGDSAGLKNGSSSQQPGVNIDLMGFSSPNKGYTVSALEAYTPERGSSSKTSNMRTGRKENINNIQASPAIWNFVQFGTPTSQTPKVEKSDEHERINDGSPIQQRKPETNDFEKK